MLALFTSLGNTPVKSSQKVLETIQYNEYLANSVCMICGNLSKVKVKVKDFVCSSSTQ